MPEARAQVRARRLGCVRDRACRMPGTGAPMNETEARAAVKKLLGRFTIVATIDRLQDGYCAIAAIAPDGMTYGSSVRGGWDQAVERIGEQRDEKRRESECLDRAAALGGGT